MTYRAIEIAKYILKYCIEKGCPISNLKLQKILYFIWVDYYKKTQNELYLDEICAWQLGPVVPEVYYEYCSYAGRSIMVDIDETAITPNDQNILNGIIDKYIHVPASTLVNKTHAPEKPWSYIYQNGSGIRDRIPFHIIKKLECGCERC